MAITFEQKNSVFKKIKYFFFQVMVITFAFFQDEFDGFSFSNSVFGKLLTQPVKKHWDSKDIFQVAAEMLLKVLNKSREKAGMDGSVQPFLPRIKQHPTRAKPQGHKISSCQNNLDFAECTVCPSDLIWWWYNVAQNLSIGKTISSAWTKSMFSYLSPNQPEPPPLFLLRKERFSSSIKILFWWKQLVHDRKKVRVRRLPGQLGAKEREPESESEIASFLKKKHFHFSEKEKTLSLSPTPELSSSKTRPCI